jgi:hypothetical protein
LSIETFRPPVFDFHISYNEPPFLSKTPDVTIIEKTSTGITITVPDDSGAESEAEEDMPSENSVPSLRAMSTGQPGMDSSAGWGRLTWLTNHTDSFLGSQANPWTIDEADMIPEPELIEVTAGDQDDEAFSESNLSNIYDEDVEEEEEEEEGLDMDDDEEPLGMSDEEESEIEDQDSEGIAESPIYTPKSPRYVPGDAETSSAVREYTPPQFGNDAGYWDGPFASYNWARANDSMFASAHQPWGVEASQQSVRAPAIFPNASQQAELSVPQHPTFTHAVIESAAVPVINTMKVTSTRELLDQNRRAYNKADMSINNLINPSPGKEPSATGAKRKADELDAEEEETVLEIVPAEVAVTAADVTSSPVVPQSEVEIESDKFPQTPESLNKEPLETRASAAPIPTTVATITTVVAEPPRKKLRTMVAKAAIFGAGVMVGSAGMLGGLMSLPDGFFQ